MQNNNNNFYNPYSNPYYRSPYNVQPNNSFQQNTQPVMFSFVQGIEGAKAFFVQPNQTVILRDSEQNILYEKSADQQGRTSMKVYDLVEKVDKPQNNNFVTYSEFDQALKKIYKKLGIRNESNANVESNVNDGK